MSKEPFKGTLAIDSLGEWARLTFAKEMGHEPWDIEDLRAVNDYGGATERIAVVCRKLKNIRDQYGVNIVVTAHEGIDKIYAKGGGIGTKDRPASEPIEVFGRPDIPGTSATNEILRSFDNILRVKRDSKGFSWVAAHEPLGGGGNTWQVKDRFNAGKIKNGYLPASYEELKKLALAEPQCNWQEPYLWMIYGPQGYQKTRSLLTFPQPIHLFDIDRGSSVLAKEEKEGKVIIHRYDSEDHRQYNKFISELFGTVADPSELTKVKKALGMS
jgi:hypothetical protein